MYASIGALKRPLTLRSSATNVDRVEGRRKRHRETREKATSERTTSGLLMRCVWARKKVNMFSQKQQVHNSRGLAGTSSDVVDVQTLSSATMRIKRAAD